MRLIEAADDELFEAVSLAAKLGRADNLLERLERRHYERPDDSRAAFSYALALLAVLPTTGSEIEVHGRFGAAADALDAVVAAVPEHWLARYLRIRLRCLLVTGGVTLQTVADEELKQANAELDELIDLQSQTGWQPYFSSTLLLAARLAAFPGQTGRSPEQVTELLAQADRHPMPQLPFRALGMLLREPVTGAHGLAAEPERRTWAKRPDPPRAAESLAGRELLGETAKSLGRLMSYLRANLGSFLDLPDGSGTLSGMGLADVGSELQETLRMARDLRSGLRSWAAGAADAAERTRAEIPALSCAIEGFLTYCEMTASVAGHLDFLADQTHSWLREMPAVREDVIRLVTLLARCADQAVAPVPDARSQ
jgi:hypothetical protein